MVPNAEYTLFEKMGFRNKRVTVTKVCKMQTFARKKTMKSLSHCVTHVSGVIALKKIRFEINMISAYLAFLIHPINFLHLEKVWSSPHSLKAKTWKGMQINFLEFSHQISQLALWFSFKCWVSPQYQLNHVIEAQKCNPQPNICTAGILCSYRFSCFCLLLQHQCWRSVL